MSRFEIHGERHPGLLPFVGALGSWTILWAVLAVQDVLGHTAMGRGTTGGSLDAYEVLEVLFVAAYAGIRWAAGAAILLAGALVVWSGMRRLQQKER